MNPLRHRLLLALDGSPASRRAVEQTIALAAMLRFEVHLVHVWDPRSGVEARLEGQRVLREGARRFQESEIAVEESLLLAGRQDLGRNIAAVARHCAAHLVALGSDGAGDVGALLRGSASHALLSEVEQPVLILRDPGRDVSLGRVLVASGGGDEDRLATALGLVALPDSEVTVLHVAEVAPGAEMPWVEPEEMAVNVVETVARRVAREGRSVRTEVRRGPVAYTIVETAREMECGLIVLGSRPPSDLAALLLSSVAHQVIHKGDRAVLVAGVTVARGGSASVAAAPEDVAPDLSRTTS